MLVNSDQQRLFLFFSPRSEDAWDIINWNVIPAIGIMTFGNYYYFLKMIIRNQARNC